jgi:hypothetical protein
MNFAAAKEKFSSVKFGGTEYALVDMAQADNYGTDGAVRYYASAINEAGDTFRVEFETTSAWDAAMAKAKAEIRGEEADLEAIAETHGVDVEEFDNIDPADETVACDWDNPVDVYPN